MKENTFIKRKSIFIYMTGFISAVLIAVLTYLVVGIVNNVAQQQSGSALYTKPVKIAPYLYEMSFTDYRADPEGEARQAVEAFGCSSVRNGNYYGRNFDYIFNDVPEFVVRVAAKEGRHASIGVATHFGLREDNMSKGEYTKQLEILPTFTLDGINDAGVIASINVVPGADDMGELTGTNPDGEPIDAAEIPRYVLDNAGSADEAIELLKKRNISGTAVSGLYLHVMIADPEKTYIVEFIDNKMVAEEKFDDEQIMTNFYNNLPELTEHSSGVERYAILKANYAEGNSLSGMRELMQRVKYSNTYMYSTSPAWLSESMPQSVINNPGSELYAQYMSAIEAINRDYWNMKANDIRNPANNYFWHTTHNAVYDIANKQLRLTVQEDYGKYYDFYL